LAEKKAGKKKHWVGRGGNKAEGVYPGICEKNQTQGGPGRREKRRENSQGEGMGGGGIIQEGPKIVYQPPRKQYRQSRQLDASREEDLSKKKMTMPSAGT